MRPLIRFVLIVIVFLFGVCIPMSGCAPPLPEDAWAGSPARGGSVVHDAATPLDAPSDAGDRPSGARIARGFLLSPWACGELRPTLPEEALDYEEGYTLWHLCYATPTTLTSRSATARQRPTSVTVSLLGLDGERELIRVAETSTLDPWLVNVLIAVPNGQAAAFKIMNAYADGEHLLMFEGHDRRFPRPNGNVRIWRVQAGHTQQEVSVRLVCRSRERPESDRACFVPDLACAKGTNDCHLLHGLDCRYPSYKQDGR